MHNFHGFYYNYNDDGGGKELEQRLKIPQDKKKNMFTIHAFQKFLIFDEFQIDNIVSALYILLT